jgi:hypothetical protein
MRVWVYACPAGERAAALAALDGLAAEYVTGRPGDQLDLAEPYYTSEAVPGESAGLAAALRAAAPGASFLIREYSVVGNPALLHACTPALGLFSGECNTAGDVVLDRDGICCLIAGAAGGSEGAPARLLLTAAGVAAGGPWLADFSARGPGSQ